MIGVYLENKLEKNIFDNYICDYINIINSKGIEKNIEVVIVDSKLEYAENKIKFYCNIGIPVMVLVDEMIDIILKSSKSKYKIKYFLRNDIVGIRKEIECISNRLSQIDTIFLSDTSKVGLIKLNCIDSITYSSVERECKFNLADGRIFSAKKKFSEIEKIQIYKDFVKIERGTIINLARIECLNYKEKLIVFKSGQILFLNKKKLKELENILFAKYNAVYL